MADTKWTPGQEDAINARQGTVLVAAAAGSGKTAVLVQRAIERLTDPQNPTDADHMLIVTFTKAAAAEMRSRLEKRLFELRRKAPGDPLLRRQSLLLSQAHIGTVDSFCSDMLREFFHLLDLSPDYKIISDKQQSEFIAQALSEAVSDAFENGTVVELADAFSRERDEGRLTEMVRSLYDFMQSHPFPEQWLREMVGLYFKGDFTPWERVILEYARETAAHCENLCTAGAVRSEDGGEVGEAFLPAFAADREKLAEVKALCAAGDWNAVSAAASAFSLTRHRNLTGYKDDPFRLRLDAIRKEIKKGTDTLKSLLSGTREQCVEELRRAAPLVESLMNLTLDFSARYDARKREQNFLDYSDLEHLAIRLFLTPDGQPTETAREVSARFDEVMIDEYQDVNDVQDSLFRAVSRDGKNLFMVGDVKQSIYSFRRAMPEIFLRCRRAYQKYDRVRNAYPAYIVLDRNFRSRSTVTDSVNYVFSQLMSRAAGDIEYTGEERLVCGAEYPAGEGYETELTLLDLPERVPAEEAEAAYLAKRIQEIVKSGLLIKEGDTRRPVNYGDFCILLRSANKYAYAYAQGLTARGVPARAAVTGGFFTAAEIGVMTSLLLVIDNPNQDIPLLAVLMSPIYGFSADDVARLRVDDKKVSLYISLTRAAEIDDRCREVLSDLSRYRSLAATMPSDAFLTHLYRKTGYTDMVLAMEGGSGRLSNLRLLQSYARDYESSGYHGISGFVRFLDRLKQNGGDLQPAETRPDGEEAVAVMSVHRSKGLEFPVCIVAGLGRQFSSDKSKEVQLHPELGLGVRLKNARSSARVTTAAREAIKLETARSDAAEELRVLYVAMTRAKEKLILLGSGKDPAEAAGKLAAEITSEGITPYTVRSAKSALQWLTLCALRHPDGKVLREEADAEGDIVTFDDYTPWRITLAEHEAADSDPEVFAPAPAKPDMELLSRLRAQIDFTYPYAGAVGLPVKVAASRLAAEQGGEPERTLARPAWMGQKGMTPAERGTALHEFMQFADFEAALEDPQKELARLVERAYLTPEQADAVDLNRVKAFLTGALGKRVLASPKVERERRFTAMIPAALAEPDRPGTQGETVILQGAVDCTFEEDGKLYIIDFKTDRVRDMEELWRRYAPQVQLYGAAMAEVTGLPIGGLYLYSMHLNEASGKET